MEIEVKASVKDLKSLRRKLIGLGAKSLRHAHQIGYVSCESKS